MSSPNENDVEIGAGTDSGKNFSRNESTLDSHDDPFAPREGKTLTWRNVNMTLAANGDDPERKLLDNVWGEVPPKQTTAVMGPSGAGKTSLLNILAGRARTHGQISIGKDIRLNNYSVDPTKMNVRQMIAFVAQDDSLQETATPREAIRFSAKLRLPRATTESQLDKLTIRMLSELGLTACADAMIGGRLLKGVSGGERKRTSVGVELVVKPALVFLDEPTSGLDSFSAVQLCQVLKKVANAGASVLFTIHQPSSVIFSSFDHLLVMNKGRLMYTGSVQDVPSYFANRGHPNPPNYNPADFIMDVAQSIPVEQLTREGFFPADERKIFDPFEPEEGQDALGITVTRHTYRGVDMYDGSPPGLLTEIRLLFQREVNNLKRDTSALKARFSLSLVVGLIVGVIFWKVGETDSSVSTNLQSHFGAVILVSLMSMFETAQPALFAFPAERPVFLREYSTNHYSAASYFLSRLTVEAFITGLQAMFIVSILCW
jgi:ABC-type multidrug transport system ATPase subunit